MHVSKVNVASQKLEIFAIKQDSFMYSWSWKDNAEAHVG